MYLLNQMLTHILIVLKIKLVGNIICSFITNNNNSFYKY